MLQQTQVATVIPYYLRFMSDLPKLVDLAAASEDKVLVLWSGLGYYRRARQLHQAAKLCVERHQGQLPNDPDALQALPGIGRSTAGAILALAWNLPYPILDGNVKRVLARYHGIAGWPGIRKVEQELWHHAEIHTPERQAAIYTQAIMDLGATVCRRSHPCCDECPLRIACYAHTHQCTSEFPEVRPKRQRPTRQATLLVLRDQQGRILLERRLQAGVWQGLWSLPQDTTTEPLRNLAQAHAKLEGCRQQNLPTIHHSFSHYHLQATPWLIDRVTPFSGIREPNLLNWWTPQQTMDLALPAPIRKFLNQLKENPNWPHT